MNLSQDTGFGSLFFYPPASNAPTDVQKVSNDLFSALQAEAQYPAVHTLFKHYLSTKINGYSQDFDEEMVPAPPSAPTLPATTNTTQLKHPVEVAPLTVSGFTGMTMVRSPLVQFLFTQVSG